MLAGMENKHFPDRARQADPPIDRPATRPDEPSGRTVQARWREIIAGLYPGAARDT